MLGVHHGIGDKRVPSKVAFSVLTISQQLLASVQVYSRVGQHPALSFLIFGKGVVFLLQALHPCRCGKLFEPKNMRGRYCELDKKITDRLYHAASIRNSTKFLQEQLNGSMDQAIGLLDEYKSDHPHIIAALKRGDAKRQNASSGVLANATMRMGATALNDQ